MIRYIKNYPFSLLTICAVIYLSFKPFIIAEATLRIPHIDKLVHLCMYAGMSGMLWVEFLWGHRHDNTPLWHAWIGAVLCPIFFSGVIEVLQSYLTSQRSGDWLDFVANVIGVLLATLVGYYVFRPYITR